MVVKRMRAASRRKENRIIAGLFLVGLGIMVYTGWWWPWGLLILTGLAIGAKLVFRGDYAEAVITAAFFIGIPIIAETRLSWDLFAPTVLIGVGVIILLNAFLKREE